MTNFNALTIPIINTPSASPPVGTRLVYFKPDGGFTQLDSDGKETRLARPVFEKNIQLSEEFLITEVRSSKQVVIMAPDISKFVSGDVILITGSSNSSNNGTYTIEEVEEDTGPSSGLVGSGQLQGTSTLVSEQTSAAPKLKTLIVDLLEDTLDTTLPDNGKLHIKRNEVVNHNLGARSVFFNLINEDTNDFVQITPKRIDQNRLEFKPDVPVLGNLLVSITL